MITESQFRRAQSTGYRCRNAPCTMQAEVSNSAAATASSHRKCSKLDFLVCTQSRVACIAVVFADEPLYMRPVVQQLLAPSAATAAAVKAAIAAKAGAGSEAKSPADASESKAEAKSQSDQQPRQKQPHMPGVPLLPHVFEIRERTNPAPPDTNFGAGSASAVEGYSARSATAAAERTSPGAVHANGTTSGNASTDPAATASSGAGATGSASTEAQSRKKGGVRFADANAGASDAVSAESESSATQPAEQQPVSTNFASFVARSSLDDATADSDADAAASQPPDDADDSGPASSDAQTDSFRRIDLAPPQQLSEADLANLSEDELIGPTVTRSTFNC